MAQHDHDRNENAQRNQSTDRPQMAALGDLHDFEVAEGYPDVRGWAVKLADGRTAGKVHELIVDTGSMRTRYLDVRLDRDLAGAAGERDVLIPVGTARLDGRGDNILVDNMTADQLASLPAYEHGALDREHEHTVRKHFSGGAAAAGAAMGASMANTGATGTSAGSQDFYAHDHFDDSRFFGSRRDQSRNQSRDQDRDQRLTLSEEELAVGKRSVEAGEATLRKTVETEHVREQVPLMREEVTIERRPISADAATDANIGEDEIRIPLTREEAVVQKRVVPTEEIIVRKQAVQETRTVEADLRRERVDESGMRGSGGSDAGRDSRA